MKFPKRLLPTTIAIGATAAVLISLAIVMAAPSPLQVHLVPPILVDSSGHVSGMYVEVTNESDSLLSPRFAVQHLQASGNPIAWPAVNSSAALQPGQSATYHIMAPEDADSFYLNNPAQVVVINGNNQYAPRGVATVSPDDSLLWPDLIANPTFSYWDAAKTSPIYWTPGSDPPDHGLIDMVRYAGRDALELTLTVKKYADNLAFLETQALFPTALFTIDVFLDPALQDSSATISGIDVDDGQHTLWIAFGKKSYSGTVSAQRMINLPAAFGQWTSVTIDLAQFYAKLGWALPPLVPTVYRGIEGDFRVVTLRLFVAADGKRNVPKLIHAYLGTIQQQPVDPKTLMTETLSDPAAYYVRIGDEQIAAGNYVRAIEAYQRALDFAPDSPDILDKLKHADDYAQQDAVHPSG